MNNPTTNKKSLWLITLFTLACFTLNVVADESTEASAESTVDGVELPLKADKTLSFTVGEATWMSLDVSSKGDQIVIEVLGDLYLLPIEGGQAQPLSTGMHYDSQPRFSPDGAQLVFVSDRDGQDDLWIMSTSDDDSSEMPVKLTSPIKFTGRIEFIFKAERVQEPAQHCVIVVAKAFIFTKWIRH